MTGGTDGRLRVGVIGCGYIGATGHLPAFAGAAAAGLCTLAGVADPDAALAERVAQPYGVPAFGSATALLQGARPAVVSIATMPSTHRDLVLEALAAGCHVLCEKPVAMNAAEAVEMVAGAERAGRLLSICFQYRTWDEARHVRQRVAAGDLGHVSAVHTWGGAAHGFPTSRARYHRASAGGGVLSHWTVHNLDLALWLLGGPEPLTASAFCTQRLARLSPGAVQRLAGAAPPGWRPEAVDLGIDDLGVGLIRLAGGTVLTVEADWLQPPMSRNEGWELRGDRGAASISPARVWIDRGEWVDETPPAGTLAPCDYDMGRMMAEFLGQAQAGGPSPISGAEIVRIQRLMDALYASAAQGREVIL
jgi:predicted dehydrogenase